MRGFTFALICVATLSISACSQTIHSCPPVPSWTPEDSEELAGEIETLPPEYDKIERALIEAKTMRDQARDCR